MVADDVILSSHSIRPRQSLRKSDHREEGLLKVCRNNWLFFRGDADMLNLILAITTPLAALKRWGRGTAGNPGERCSLLLSHMLAQRERKMAKPYAHELTLSFGALRAAAQLSQSIIGSRDKGTLEKDDLSPVTVADFAVQALLTATFARAFPGDTIVGEEDASGLRENSTLLKRVWALLQGLDARLRQECTLPSSPEHMCELIDLAGSSKPATTGRTWIFDPIDGTKTYLRGQLYAINIGLLVDGQQMLGSIGCPNLSMEATAPLNNADVDVEGGGCIVYAVRGQGAHVRSIRDGNLSRRLHAQQAAAAADEDGKDRTQACRFVTCVSLVDSALDDRLHGEIAARLDAAASFPGCDLVPWVLRWAALALGLGNTTVWVYKSRGRHAKVWDHAGAVLLFEETGGKVTDVLGRDLNWTAGRKMEGNFGFVAAADTAHAGVLAVVQQVLREKGHGDMLLL